jgi:hypothetical protein
MRLIPHGKQRLTIVRAGEGDASQPNFKVDIRNAPIAEEDGDASAAMANVTNALRMVRR